MVDKIEKILVVINEAEAIEKLLRKAAELQRTNNAVLEILFVHENRLFDIPDYFRTSETGGLDKKSIKAEIEKVLSSLETASPYAVFIEESDTVDRVAAMIGKDTHTLILSAFREEITAKLAKKVSTAMLVLKSDIPEYRHILFPVDMNENNERYIQSVQTLFPSASIKLLFEPSYVTENYIFDEDFVALPLDPAVDIEFDQEMLETQKEAFEALKKRTGLSGEIVNELDADIVAYINRQKADLVVLHSENENFLFDDTLSKDLLTSIKTDLFIF